MASRLLNLISKKTNLHVQHAFFLSLSLFCTTTTTKAGLFPPHPFFKGKALGTRLFLKVRAAMRFLSK